MTEQRTSWLARLSGVPIIGEWVTTVVGLAPMFPLFALGLDLDKQSWGLFVAAVLLVPWLLLLERWQGVAITTPYVPIKIVWIIYVVIVVSGAKLVGSWF